MSDDQFLFWAIVVPAIVAWIVLEVRRHRSHRKPVVMMARPMTKYEKERR